MMYDLIISLIKDVHCQVFMHDTIDQEEKRTFEPNANNYSLETFATLMFSRCYYLTTGCVLITANNPNSIMLK